MACAVAQAKNVARFPWTHPANESDRAHALFRAARFITMTQRRKLHEVRQPPVIILLMRKKSSSGHSAKGKVATHKRVRLARN